MARARPKPRPKPVPFEGRIEALGAQGDGIAPGPDGPVYAPFTLPGERIEGLRTGDRLGSVTILEPSANRVAPPCPVFGQCGGCALQHGADGFLAAWKQRKLADALAARGLGAVPIREIVTIPPATRRRVTLHYTVHGKALVLGFQARGSHALVDCPDCLVVSPGLKAAWPGLRALAGVASETAPSGQIHALDSETGLDLDLRLTKDVPLSIQTALTGMAQRLGAARLTFDGVLGVEWRPPAVTFGSVAVTPPPGGFLQPSREGQDALIRLVTEALLPHLGPKARIADLFSGCGTFTFPLAERHGVHALEMDETACAALDKAARKTSGLKPVSVERRDLFRRPLTPKELARFEAAVIDPPRAGADAQMRDLARSDVRRIAAVSCNPASFARDARTLVDGGYTLHHVTPVDQFAWSPHIECVGVFERA